MASAQGFEIVTLFPALVDAYATEGLIAKAIARRRIEIHATDPRAFVNDAGYRSVDDTPFGGGPGMVMQAEPVARAIESIEAARGPSLRILVTPSAPRFDQRAAEALARAPRLTFLCGRYEGIDDRIRESMVDRCFSLGDFVLNGGELAALAMVEAIARLRPGVLGNADSVRHESFAKREGASCGDATLLEHPQYTKPATWRGLGVPPVLQAGDHQAIARWRRHCALARTWALRPDLRQRELAEPNVAAGALAKPAGARPRVAWAIICEGAPPAPEHREALAQVANDRGVELWWVGPGAPKGFRRARALRDLRRALRTSDGAAPAQVRLWASDAAAPASALVPPALYEALTREDSRETEPRSWILLSSFGPQAGKVAYEATMTLRAAPLPGLEGRAEKDRTDPPNGLANAGALIDISQPAAPSNGRFAATLERVNAALDGLFGPVAPAPEN